MTRIKGSTEHKTFVYMWSGARHMLNVASTSQEGQVYTLVSAQVFIAFMVEAYLNHLGALLHSDWRQTERKRSKKAKLLVLAREVGLSPDMSKRPYSSISKLFAHRDSMAHGRTEVRDIDAVANPRLSVAQNLSSVGWQADLTVQQTETLLADAEEVVRELHTASGCPGNPFATSGGGHYVIVDPGT